jgi:hypothetical protein
VLLQQCSSCMGYYIIIIISSSSSNSSMDSRTPQALHRAAADNVLCQVQCMLQYSTPALHDEGVMHHHNTSLVHSSSPSLPAAHPHPARAPQPVSAAIQGRTPLAHQQLVQAASQLQVSSPAAAAAAASAAATSSQPSSPGSRHPTSSDAAACSSSSASAGPPGPDGRPAAAAAALAGVSRSRLTQDEGGAGEVGGSMGGAAGAGAGASSRSSSSVRTRKFHKLLDEPLVSSSRGAAGQNQGRRGPPTTAQATEQLKVLTCCRFRHVIVLT